MATEIGSLTYNLDIDDKGLKGKLDTADKSVQGFGDNVGKAGSDVRATLNKAAIGIGVVGAGLTLFAKNATSFTEDYVKSSKKLSRETGASIEDASRLLSVTNKLGLSTEQVSQTFGLFSKKINETNKATDVASTSLGQLGISTKNASGVAKPFNDILLEVSDKFKTMPAGATKTALAMDLFGRSGKDMIPFLNLGSAAISNLQKEADKLGLTLTPGSVDKINALIASQKLLKQQTDATKISVGLLTAPVLTEFNLKLNEMIGFLMQSDGPFKTITANALAFGGPILSATAGVIGFAANVAQLGVSLAAFTGFAVFAGLAVAASGTIIGAFVLARNAVVDALNAINHTMNAVESAGNSMDDAIRKIKASNLSPAEKARRIRSISTAGVTSFGSGFAKGGPVSAGVPITVGEKGRELFVPNSNGTIIPNNKLGGMGNTFTGNIYLGDSGAVKTFFDKLDRNIQLESMGLSPMGN